MANDGDGMTYGEMAIKNVQENHIVTPEELSLLIGAGAKRDIEVGSITHPPKVETTLALAADFFDTYLYDTDLDRIEVTDRYAVELITQLEASEDIAYAPREEEVIEYVTTVHEALSHSSRELQDA